MSEQEYVSMVNSIIGQYKLKQFIGAGTSGGVFLAVNRNDQNQEYAFKMQTYLAEGEIDMINTFIKLKPEKWIKIYDTFQYNKWTCVVMQIAKHDLGQELMLQQDNKFQNEDEIKSIILQISRGIQSLHKLGQIHRDLKPENILKLDDDTFALCDLGLITSNDRAIKTMNVGTQYYMAPEQCKGNGEYTSAVDIWAIGIIMFELKFGLFQPDDNHQQVIANSMINGFTIFQNPQLNEILNKTITNHPDDRLNIYCLIDKLTHRQKQSAIRIQSVPLINNNLQQKNIVFQPNQITNRVTLNLNNNKQVQEQNSNQTVCCSNPSSSNAIQRTLYSQTSQQQTPSSNRIIIKPSTNQPKQTPQIKLPNEQTDKCDQLQKQLDYEKVLNQQLKEHIIKLNSEIEQFKLNKPEIKIAQRDVNQVRHKELMEKNQELEQEVLKLTLNLGQLQQEYTNKQEQHKLIEQRANELDQNHLELQQLNIKLKEQENVNKELEQGLLEFQQQFDRVNQELSNEQIHCQNITNQGEEYQYEQSIAHIEELRFQINQYKEHSYEQEEKLNILQQEKQQNDKLVSEYIEKQESYTQQSEKLKQITQICGNQKYEDNINLIQDLIRILDIFKKYQDKRTDQDYLNELRNDTIQSESRIILDQFIQLQELLKQYNVPEQYKSLLTDLLQKLQQPSEYFIQRLEVCIKPIQQQTKIDSIQDEITKEYHKEKYNNQSVYFKQYQ